MNCLKKLIILYNIFLIVGKIYEGKELSKNFRAIDFLQAEINFKFVENLSLSLSLFWDMIKC